MDFGAVAYPRSESPEGLDVGFETARIRITPLQTQSFPRFKLQGAFIPLLLARQKKEDIRIVGEPTLLTDSTCVLSWIHAKKFPPVRRILEGILEGSSPPQLCHVLVDENPEDDASRGLHPSELMTTTV